MARTQGSTDRLTDQLHQVGMAFDRRELRELPLHHFRRVEQNADVRLGQHGGVVERIAGGDDVVVEQLQRGHRPLLLFGDAQLVIDDAIVLDHKPVAQQGGPAKLAEQGRGELLEGVRQNDHLDERAEFVEELLAAGQRVERADDVLDVGQLQSVPVEQVQAPPHQLVVVRLVPGGEAQAVDPGLLGHGNPDFRGQHALPCPVSRSIVSRAGDWQGGAGLSRLLMKFFRAGRLPGPRGHRNTRVPGRDSTWLVIAGENGIHILMARVR